MKTILIAHNYTKNSFSIMSYELAHYLADLGNRIVFISHKPFFSEPEIIKKEKGEIIICSWPGQQRPTSLKDVLWFSKLYFKYQPDSIIGHFGGANITIGISKILSFNKVKTFCYYHTLSKQIALDSKGNFFRQKIFVYRKKIFYKFFCNVIICPSKLAKEDLKNVYNSNKGFVLLNPLKDRFENKNIQEENKIVISYLGRLDPSKGILELLEAFLLYKKKNEASKIILNIAGGGSLDQKVKEKADVEETINFLGGISYDKVDEYLSKSHFVIIPSKIDNLPTVGLESLMNKTPLLISNTTGLSEYLEDGKDCFKFTPNVESIDLLLHRVENNFIQQSQMSKFARETFLNKFGLMSYCVDFSNQILQ
ncbi:glycosyltransferase family 4 protein [Flavobacterium anhuiense]|uniref:glycosyltransferase family 4 protein n=1 Tax=Flavobacterium anhuiense TaxID=459526 RepID=UPI003D991852